MTDMLHTGGFRNGAFDHRNERNRAGHTEDAQGIVRPPSAIAGYARRGAVFALSVTAVIAIAAVSGQRLSEKNASYQIDVADGVAIYPGNAGRALEVSGDYSDISHQLAASGLSPLDQQLLQRSLGQIEPAAGE